MNFPTLIKRFVFGVSLALAVLGVLHSAGAAHADGGPGPQVRDHRTGTGSAAAPSATPRLLGGLNLDAFCQARGGLGSAVRFGRWVCYAETNFDVDFQDACQWAYNVPLDGLAPDVLAFPIAEATNPLAVNCFTTSSHLLGGLNLKAYCQSRGATGVVIMYNMWTCDAPTGDFAILMKVACEWTYGPGAYPASPRGNHLIVNCFR